MADTTTANLVDALFREHLRPDGREYTYEDVARISQGRLTSDAIRKVRVGMIKNPTRETMLELCRAFHVSPTYFFPELASDPVTTNELSARIAQLSPEARKQIEQLLDALLTAIRTA